MTEMALRGEISNPACVMCDLAHPIRLSKRRAPPLGNISRRSSSVRPNSSLNCATKSRLRCSLPSACASKSGRIRDWKSGIGMISYYYWPKGSIHIPRPCDIRQGKPYRRKGGNRWWIKVFRREGCVDQAGGGVGGRGWVASRISREAVDCGSLMPPSAMQPCCEPDGIGILRRDHSQSSAVDNRLSHGRRQQAAAVQGLRLPPYTPSEILPEKRGESLVDQGFSPGRVRGSGGWRGWREYGEGDCIPFA